jgi:adenine phosphoribosyltransferase
MIDLKSTIRDVVDFPQKGIVFKDITTLLKDREAFKEAAELLAEPFREERVDGVVGIESRGFILGGLLAYLLNTGFVPVRKLGKLPAETLKEEYALEYGTNTVEIHKDAVSPGQRILVVDDLLATGGTAAAAVKLVQRLGGEVMGLAFLIELDFLSGRNLLRDLPIHVLIHYS